jgi:DNA-binding transcriptional ArsR family regulator
MQPVLYLDGLEQAEILLKPGRVALLRRLAEPRSCTELAADLDETPQKIYYHVKKLEAAGLVEKVAERRVRGIVEGIYQARARSYWLSPQLVGQVGGRRRAEEELSLGFLLDLAEALQSEIAELAVSERDVPSLGLSGEVRLEPERREAFLRELRSTFEELLSRHGGGEGQAFRIALACYPKGDSQ